MSPSLFKKNILGILIVLITGCHSRNENVSISDNQVALAWAEMTLYVTKNTPANSPTYSSRCLGYIGLTMYESMVHSDPNYNSIASQLNGLGELTLPKKDKRYNFAVAMNAAQSSILKNLYNQTSDLNKSKIDSLEAKVRDSYSHLENSEVISRSEDFGRMIAQEIYSWSLQDGGHRGYLSNFDKKLKMPAEPGCWEPPLYGQSFSHYPLHPYWGKNRTFLKQNSLIDAPPMIRYDTTKNSEYEKLFQEVYSKNIQLTQEEKEIALWWGDDPGETFTPAGHSYYLAFLVLKKSNANAIKCAETFARVGMAVADAFINCWKWKYQYASERPSSYITKRIDNRWESFWPDPPFPAFPSGHATQAAAVAQVLTDLHGSEFEFVDDAHATRPKDEIRDVEFKKRTYRSFWQVAEETALSRFYGGIHTAQDNNAGLLKGKEIGENINRLHWQNDAALANF